MLGKAAKEYQSHRSHSRTSSIGQVSIHRRAKAYKSLNGIVLPISVNRLDSEDESVSQEASFYSEITLQLDFEKKKNHILDHNDSVDTVYAEEKTRP